jgi:hypothetical protein
VCVNSSANSILLLLLIIMCVNSSANSILLLLLIIMCVGNSSANSILLLLLIIMFICLYVYISIPTLMCVCLLRITVSEKTNAMPFSPI